MKAFILIVVCIFLSAGNLVKSQDRRVPDIDIYTLDGKRVSTSDIAKSSDPVVLLFWNTTDMKSLAQLSAINDGYEDQLKWKNVKIIAICTDCPGAEQSVKPFVNGNDISLDIYIDRNNDLKRAMSVGETPFTIVIDQEKNSYSMITGYCANIVDIIKDKCDKSFARVSSK